MACRYCLTQKTKSPIQTEPTVTLSSPDSDQPAFQESFLTMAVGKTKEQVTSGIFFWLMNNGLAGLFELCQKNSAVVCTQSLALAHVLGIYGQKAVPLADFLLNAKTKKERQLGWLILRECLSPEDYLKKTFALFAQLSP